MRLAATLNIGGTFQTQEHPPPQPQHQSPPPGTSPGGWKSPVPYLFGGLAAMLGLIAFALLILACSYWKLSGHHDAGEDSGDFSGDEKTKGEEKGSAAPFENSILVIMAGEAKPTYLATPATSRVTSFGDSETNNNATCSCSCSSSSSSSSSRNEGEEEDDHNNNNNREKNVR